MSLPASEGKIPNYLDINKNLIHETMEHLFIAASTASTSSAFSTAKDEIVITVEGSYDVWIDVDTTATTASGFKISPNETRKIYGSISEIYAITNTGTANVHIIGFGD